MNFFEKQSLCQKLQLNENDFDRLVFAFQVNKKELALVGGCVRDILLDRRVHDVDATTNARPDEIKEILKEAGFTSLYTMGEKFGTIGVNVGSTQIEITTYRTERYVDGDRHPEVQFGSSLDQDLSRRDFTINAIAYDVINHRFVDPFNGRKDLEWNVISAVGDARERFREDPLRLFRAVRFESQLLFRIEVNTWIAMRQCASLITEISQERMRDELCKLLLGVQPKLALEDMHSVGLLVHVLPELEALIGIEQHPFHLKDAFEHTLLVVDHIPNIDLVALLAGLFHDIGKAVTRTEENGISHFREHEDRGAEMTEKAMKRLCFDNDTIRKVTTIVRLHMRVNGYRERWSDSAVRKLVLAAGDTWDELLQVARGDRNSDLAPEYSEAAWGHLEALEKRVKQLNAKIAPADLKSPLDGNELMTLFGKRPGSWIKEIKEHLTEKVLDGSLDPANKEKAREEALLFFQA